MFYGAPVTAPMEIPPEAPRSPWRPDDPELKDMPGILDAGLDGLRLQNTEVKALPGMPVVDIGTGARALEAAEYSRNLGIATDRFKSVENYSRRLAAAKDTQAEQASKEYSRSSVSRGNSRSNYNRARSKAVAWRTAPRGSRQYLTTIR